MKIQKLYELLSNEFGSLTWWPVDKGYHEKNGSDPRFEVMAGAILTQNTAWSNVEKALVNIKLKNLLDCKALSETKIETLQKMVKPSGFFNQKAKRLKDFAAHIQKNYNGDLNKFFKRDLREIRKELLSLNGIGPETADSILLYAGNKPIFVVDAYTKRICQRLPIDVNISYDEIQEYFQKELLKIYKKEKITKVYNELHAQIVNLAKIYCKKKPACANCPIKKNCLYEKESFQ